MASIQKLRLQQGWSQQQLADASGLSARTIQRLEAGAAPSVESLKSIAAVFEVDFQSLKENDMLQTAHTGAAHATAMQATNDPLDSNHSANASAQAQLEREEAQAFHYVRKLKGLYRHAAQYAVVIPLLWALNLWQGIDYMWAVWPTLGWGIGLAVHALSLRVFGQGGRLLGPQWEREQVERHLGRPLS